MGRRDRLALPFLLIGFVPALRRRLPKPGAWMERFRRILSVPMWLTAIALAWVLGRSVGVEGMTLALLLALLTAGSYAELVTKYPRAGGAAVFAQRAYRSPIVSFLVGFCMLAAGVVSGAHERPPDALSPRVCRAERGS